MEHRGRCRCGAVRYAFDDVVDAGYCHCAACRRATGAPVSGWVVPRGLQIEGEPRRHDDRGFCATCGTPLFAWDGDRVEVQVGTLDAPIAPRVHRHVEQQLPWLKLDDHLGAGGRIDGDPPRGAAITLREITEANLRAILLLDVESGQRRLVATNAMFLIDERFQRRGFGGRALAIVLAELSRWGGNAIWLACVPGAAGPYALYRSFGFEDTGVIDPDGEVVMRWIPPR